MSSPALYTVSSGNVALAAAVTKSLILLNPVVGAMRVRQIDVSLGQAAAAEEVLFDLYRVETIGPAAGAAGVVQLADEKDAAAGTTALINLTSEPTAVKVLASYLLQPLGGLLSIPLNFGAEIATKAAGARIGLRYTTAAAVTPKCVAQLWFEE